MIMCPLNKKFLQKLSMIFLKNIELMYFDQKKTNGLSVETTIFQELWE